VRNRSYVELIRRESVLVPVVSPREFLESLANP
jgi:hypothetical protein